MGSALREGAARGDLPRLAQLLKDCPKIVNEPDENGCTALQRAAADGHSEAVELLLQHGADPNRQDNLHGNTALHEAAWKGYSRCARLLSARARPHTRNRGGFAPLHLACQNGHNQTCREILLAGCDPDIQNNYGDTSLHTSARYGHAGVTRILISAECHVSDQNKNGDTALHIAAAMGRRKLTRILLEAGSNKILKNKQNETPKDIALRKELHEIIDILNVPSSKSRKDAKIKEKEKRDKSVERTIDVPDVSADRDVTMKSKEKDSHASPSKQKEKRKSKNVHFESNAKHWSPYGCHYYPDPKNFPKPNLDSLPKEPLKKGEQYYLDLAGNICKGPVGVGYTCYCAPFFRHMEDKLNRDKQEIKHHIDKAHEKLDQKVTSLELRTQGQISELTRCVAAERVLCRERQEHLEQWLTRGIMFRASERVRKINFSPKGSVDLPPLKRTQSLEMLDTTSKTWNIIRCFNDKAFHTKNQMDDFRKSLRNTSKSADVLDGNAKPDLKKSGAIKKESHKSKETLISSSRRSENDHRSDTRASVKSSEKSSALSNYNYEASKFNRTGSGSSHHVTAEIHVKSNKSMLPRSPMNQDTFHQSESDEKYSSPNKRIPKSILSQNNVTFTNSENATFPACNMMEQNKFARIYQKGSEIVNDKPKLDYGATCLPIQKEQTKNCFEEIENDGYIRIPKHPARSDENFSEPAEHLCSNDINDSSTHETHLHSPSQDFQIQDAPILESGSRKSVHELVAKIQEQQLIDEIQRISRSPVRDLKSPARNFDGSISRPLTPNYLNSPTSPTKTSVHNWQNNSIPLSDSTHFNTIEPINSPIIQQSPAAHAKTEQHVKSPKKFSFHNLIPFPSRKMFNFQQKSDGNKSESSDEEDAPIRTALEPGLMKNSNLLTTLPLPNYENMISGQNAQPQIPLKTLMNGHCMNNGSHMALRGSLLPIPKDAYFHEMPNRQRLHDNQSNPNSRLPIQYQISNHVHPQPHHHFNNSTSLAPPCFNNVGQTNINTDNFALNYGRSRNPVYNSNNLLTEMMHDHINRELSRTPHAYANQAGHNSQIEMPNMGDASMHQGFLRRFPTDNLDHNLHGEGNHYPPQLIANDEAIPLEGHILPSHSHVDQGAHLPNHLHNLAINTHLSELQSQLDRDSHNDSGYSTKVYGSSQGASPSLSGNIDCSENLPNQKLGMAMNRTVRSTLINPSSHSHIGASSLV